MKRRQNLFKPVGIPAPKKDDNQWQGMRDTMTAWLRKHEAPRKRLFVPKKEQENA